MSENKESSVLFSLQELLNLEKSRVLDEQREAQRQQEAEVQRRLEAEQRALAAEAARVQAEEQRQQAEQLRRRMEDAQIEAAKEAEIERVRLHQQHVLEMDALARQRDHEKQLEQLAAARPKGLPRSALAALTAVALAAIAAVVFLVFIQPVSAAKVAVQRAATAAALDEPPSWAEADRQLAIARDKDPGNPGIPVVEATLRSKREALAAKEKARDEAREKELADAKKELAAKEKALADEKDPLRRKQLEDDIKSLQPKAGPTPPPAPKPKRCKPVPGCPLCPEICN